MASTLSAPYFHSEDAAFEYVESHLWPNGPICPHCGNADATKIGRLTGPSVRAGLRKCYACRKQFTVRIGSIFKSSHCPLRYWLQAIALMCSSKKGISTRQLQRILGVGMKTAWFLGYRIREAIKKNYGLFTPPMGCAGELSGAACIVTKRTTILANFDCRYRTSKGERS
jgi:transposase-like protein